MDISTLYKREFEHFLNEDELGKISRYMSDLPQDDVQCLLKLKDDLILAGLPFFFGVFSYLGNKASFSELIDQYEGSSFKKEDNAIIEFKLPFNIALTGERIALNLLQRCSSIATYTQKFVQRADGISILDTRKTTPGLRFVEKYAVVRGGGKNHRFSQTDIFMIKDNHKTFFGGVVEAVKFFNEIKGFYQPIILEVHDLSEIEQGYSMGIKHFLLDNFTAVEIQDAIKYKQPSMTYEVSGGITLDNLSSYVMEGIDAFSTGAITYGAPQVDISMKMKK